jgi:hypothetical protein
MVGYTLQHAKFDMLRVFYQSDNHFKCWILFARALLVFHVCYYGTVASRTWYCGDNFKGTNDATCSPPVLK